VTSDDGTWFDGVLSNAGDMFNHTFAATGSYTYHCVIHPGMTGTVIVH
jgi:plastocyanin